MNPGAPKGRPRRKKAIFLSFSPPVSASILTHFRLKMRKSDEVTALGGDLEPTHISNRNFFKTGEPRSLNACLKHTKYAVGCMVGGPRTSKMCMKQYKYAVGCKVGFLSKQVFQMTVQISSLQAFGVTLEHFGQPMAPQSLLF